MDLNKNAGIIFPKDLEMRTEAVLFRNEGLNFYDTGIGQPTFITIGEFYFLPGI